MKENCALARRNEFYARVVKTISHSFAALTREILFLQLEHKISISSPLCNILYVFFLGNYIHSYSYSLWFSVLVFPTYVADLLLVKRKLC